MTPSPDVGTDSTEGFTRLVRWCPKCSDVVSAKAPKFFSVFSGPVRLFDPRLAREIFRFGSPLGLSLGTSVRNRNVDKCPQCGATVQQAEVPIDRFDEELSPLGSLLQPTGRREPFSANRVMSKISARLLDTVLVGIPYVAVWERHWPFLYVVLVFWEFAWLAAVRASPVMLLFGMRVAGPNRWKVAVLRSVVLYGLVGVLTVLGLSLVGETILLVTVVAGYPLHDLAARSRVVWVAELGEGERSLFGRKRITPP